MFSYENATLRACTEEQAFLSEKAIHACANPVPWSNLHRTSLLLALRPRGRHRPRTHREVRGLRGHGFPHRLKRALPCVAFTHEVLNDVGPKMIYLRVDSHFMTMKRVALTLALMMLVGTLSTPLLSELHDEMPLILDDEGTDVMNAHGAGNETLDIDHSGHVYEHPNGTKVWDSTPRER